MGQNWAIVVGIDEYDNLRRLNYAERDAESVRDFFGELGFEEIYFFAKGAPPIPGSNGTAIPADPTTSRLWNFLRRRLQRRPLEAGDTLWFFFAGHGKRRGERDYLMPIDGDPGDLERTGVAVRELVEVLRGSGAGNVILLVDACRDDGSRDGVGIGLEKQQGVITLFSCAPEQQSYEIEELQAGAFTYALVQGLRIQGEGNCATVARLAEHVRVQVPYLVERYRGVKVKQNPYLVAEPASKQNLIVLPRQASSADVAEVKNAALQAEIEGDLELAEVFWSRILIANPSSYQEVFRAIQRLAIKKHTVEQIKSTPSDRPERTQPVAMGDRSGDESNRNNDSSKLNKLELETFKFEVVQLDFKGQTTRKNLLQNQGFTQRIQGADSLIMMQIPAGTFMMGSPSDELQRDADEGPQHQVSVPAFFMSKTLVTQAQWKAVAQLKKVQRDLTAEPSNFKGPNRPVEQVSWDDATEFCARLSRETELDYRLPSEAEWEYACRASTTTPFYFGETITTDVANYRGEDWELGETTYPGKYGDGPYGEFRKQTTDVGRFPSNLFGLSDMHGNVWEWCQDWWHENYEVAPTNGSSWVNQKASEPDLRVLRGGSWGNDPGFCRSAMRYRLARDSRNFNLGFRVVCGVARSS